MQKQKRGAEGSDKAKDSKTNDLEPRVVRFFPQKKSISDAVTHSSPRLSKELLAGVLIYIPILGRFRNNVFYLQIMMYISHLCRYLEVRLHDIKELYLHKWCMNGIALVVCL